MSIYLPDFKIQIPSKERNQHNMPLIKKKRGKRLKVNM